MARQGRERVARSADAEVLAVLGGSERILLREVGRQDAFEALAPLEVVQSLGAGARVTVYFDDRERVVGWYWRDAKVGVLEGRE